MEPNKCNFTILRNIARVSDVVISYRISLQKYEPATEKVRYATLDFEAFGRTSCS